MLDGGGSTVLYCTARCWRKVDRWVLEGGRYGGRGEGWWWWISGGGGGGYAVESGVVLCCGEWIDAGGASWCYGQ